MNDDISGELYALIQKLDAHIARADRLEDAIAENRSAIAENRIAIEANKNAIEANKNAIEVNRNAILDNGKAILDNGKAIARLEGKIAGSIIIIGLAAGLLGPLVMVIVNLVIK